MGQEGRAIGYQLLAASQPQRASENQKLKLRLTTAESQWKEWIWHSIKFWENPEMLAKFSEWRHGISRASQQMS